MDKKIIFKRRVNSKDNSGNVYIYALIDPRDKEVRYIGKTTDIDYRLAEHLQEANRGGQLCKSGGIVNSHKVKWIRLLSKSGLRPEISIIEVVNDDNWKEREIFWISHYGSIGKGLVNATGGGDGIHGPSEETREKMREGARSRMIKNNPMFNAESRERHRVVCKSPERRESARKRMLENNPMSNPEYIKNHAVACASEERKIKISKSMSGDNHPANKNKEYRARLITRMTGDGNPSKDPLVVAKILAKRQGKPSPLKGKLRMLTEDQTKRLSDGVRNSWSARREKYGSSGGNKGRKGK